MTGTQLREQLDAAMSADFVISTDSAVRDTDDRRHTQDARAPSHEIPMRSIHHTDEPAPTSLVVLYPVVGGAAEADAGGRRQSGVR